MNIYRHRLLIGFLCASYLLINHARSTPPKDNGATPRPPLTVTLAAEKDVYIQPDFITVTLVFSNSTTSSVTVLGPFMIRNTGVCGILSVDGYWFSTAPAELKTSIWTTANDYEDPREFVIGPNQTKSFRRTLIIPSGMKKIVQNGKEIIDMNGQWSKGTHRMTYSYTCSLFGLIDSPAQEPFVGLGINDPSKYWQGNLESPTIEVLVK